jgi:DNA polymerase
MPDAAANFVLDDTPFTTPPLPTAQKTVALRQLDDTQVKGCPKCRLSETRTHTVFGEGSPDARLMFIGEGPGENEDLAGRPFVGKAGQLLEKMINAMGLKREDVYICNIVKCRPPNNRQPAADETAACTPYLLEQVSIVRPQVIVTLGLPSSQFILRTKNSMSKLRGRWHSWRGIDVMPTYHPAYVLRQYTPQTREAVWSDLKLVLTQLGLPLPKR